MPATPPAGPDSTADWAVTRAGILYWGHGDADEAVRVLETAPADDLVRATLSWIQFFDGRCAAALTTAEGVLAGPAASVRATVWAAMSGAAAAGTLGHTARARAIARRGRAAVAHRGGDLPWADAQIGYGLCFALHADGRLTEARTLTDRGYARALAAESGEMVGMWAGFRGVVAKAQGRFADARAHLREAIALLADNDEYQQARICHAELAGVLALTGDAVTAVAALDRAEGRRHGCNRLYEPWIALDRAWVSAAAGLTTTAIAHARRAAGSAVETQQPAYEAIALYDVARLGAAASVCRRLEEIAGDHARLLARAASALAGADAAALEQVSADFAGAGHLLHAAETAVAAASALRRAGRIAAAHAAAERAAALCPGARTPLLESGDASPVLTRREREIARLAIDLPSRAVADRLGLSVRTVDNTLARAYAKLGVTGRESLAAALGVNRPGSSSSSC